MTAFSAIKTTFCLQPIVFCYALVSVLSKTASGLLPEFDGNVMCWLWECITECRLVLCVTGMFLGLGVYAIVWQKIIRDAKIGLVYANKSSELFWMLLAASALFGERISVLNVLGVLLIFFGIVLTNLEMKE